MLLNRCFNKNDADQYPGICKGQRSAEKEQHQSGQELLRLTEKQASIMSLKLVQGTLSGFVTFYSASLRRQFPLFVSKDKREVIVCSLQPPLVTFGPHVQSHAGFCHVSSTRTRSWKNNDIFSALFIINHVAPKKL